jgi:ribonuclease HII
VKQDPFLQHLIAKHHTAAFTDAVGTGALFGPITACAVTMLFDCANPEVDDSKKLKHETIYRLALVLKKSMTWTLGIVSAEEIRQIKNVMKGECLAMTRAVQALKEKVKIDAVFVDGKHTLPDTQLPSYAVIKGDQKIYGIAAASIIAKNDRDHFMMSNYGKKFSQYRIYSNKGYRSPDHLLAIRKFGVVHPHHRIHLPQIQRVLSGNYDSVIFSKYKNRWEKLNKL